MLPQLYDYLYLKLSFMKKKSVFYYGATLCNSVPPEVRICDNIDDLKSKLYRIID